MIKYSIITPVFNRADCIERCLESVSQNIKERNDVEHIVVDDGSADQTPVMLKQYAVEHPHVHCIFFPHNRGTNAARNAAIACAKGCFCIFLDSDDYWDYNALTIIDDTVSSHQDIRHFCFATDDMQPVYTQISLLSGKSECLMAFEDFLLGKVSGDFVHVMSTDIIKRHPFDEELRIHEGVFFLAFYKEAGKIFFVNKIVSHRERGRSDSVTREVLRINRAAILREVKATELLVERYSGDFEKIGNGQVCLLKHQLRLIDDYLLLCDYRKAQVLMQKIEQSGEMVVPILLKIVCRFRLGMLYFVSLNINLRIKYNVLCVKMK